MPDQTPNTPGEANPLITEVPGGVNKTPDLRVVPDLITEFPAELGVEPVAAGPEPTRGIVTISEEEAKNNPSLQKLKADTISNFAPTNFKDSENIKEYDPLAGLTNPAEDAKQMAAAAHGVDHDFETSLPPTSETPQVAPPTPETLPPVTPPTTPPNDGDYVA